MNEEIAIATTTAVEATIAVIITVIEGEVVVTATTTTAAIEAISVFEFASGSAPQESYLR